TEDRGQRTEDRGQRSACVVFCLLSSVLCPLSSGTIMPPVALITGASRGIGRGICLALARKGYAIAINYAGNEQAARETQRLLGDAAESILCRADVGGSADRQRLVDEVLARWDRVDVLVNNAGITSVGRRD